MIDLLDLEVFLEGYNIALPGGSTLLPFSTSLEYLQDHHNCLHYPIVTFNT